MNRLSVLFLLLGAFASLAVAACKSIHAPHARIHLSTAGPGFSPSDEPIKLTWHFYLYSGADILQMHLLHK